MIQHITIQPGFVYVVCVCVCVCVCIWSNISSFYLDMCVCGGNACESVCECLSVYLCVCVYSTCV